MLKVRFDDFEIMTRSRSVPIAVSTCSDLQHFAIALLQGEMLLPKPVRLLGGISLLAAGLDRNEPQLGLRSCPLHLYRNSGRNNFA
jgi:DNA polymerase IV